MVARNFCQYCMPDYLRNEELSVLGALVLVGESGHVGVSMKLSFTSWTKTGITC